MSATIKAAITALKGRIAAAYSAISAKGGTLPATQDSDNLASAIATIPSGGSGVSLSGYNYSDPSSIEGIGQAIWRLGYADEVTEIVDSITDMNIDNTSGRIKEYNLTAAFVNLTSLTFTKQGILRNGSAVNVWLFRYSTLQHLSLPFTQIGFSSSTHICHQTNSLKSLSFPNLTIPYPEQGTGGTFAYSCSALTTLNFPTYVGRMATDTNPRSWSIQFAYGCAALESVTIPEMKYFQSYSNAMFESCANLKYVYLPKLEYYACNTSTGTFYNCLALKEVQFGTISANNPARALTTSALANLEKFEVGEGSRTLPTLSTWTAANVADDALLNTNIATYLAGRLYDYTGGTAHSITISTALYNRLTQATKDIFTNKNWTIVTA